MNKNYFEVVRGGIHTTFQDNGFLNTQHLGITTGGAVDRDLFKLANKLVNNDLHIPVIEFALQGPQLRLKKGKCRFAITGNVVFNILRKEKIIEGAPNRSYVLYEEDILDILSTIKSNYGYLSVEGGFAVTKHFGCSSTLVQSRLGPNQGEKISNNQLICFHHNGSETTNFLNYNPDIYKDNSIRVLQGPQMNYFERNVINDFYSKPFVISNATNRMGIRIEGNTIYSIKSHNINSEGIVKGSIQVPGNGNPIILMSDHPTIGGYPKIAIVILADIAKIAQLTVGTKFNFKEVSLEEAENIYKVHNEYFKNILSKIKNN